MGSLEREKTLTPEEGRLLFQNTLNDNRELKGRQWSATYYVTLLLAGIFGLYNTIHEWPDFHHDPWRGWLVLAAIFIGVAGVLIILKIQSSLKKNRIYLENLSARSCFSCKFCPSQEIGECYGCFCRDWHIWFPMIASIFVSTIFVIAALFINQG